jgi:ribose-phosphate pyrophosphokinase
MLDIAYELKRKNAKKIYCYGTYAVFTHGFDKFARAYDEGIISGVLGTNLTYCPEELLGMEWYHQVDVSKYISYFVDSMNHDVSVNSIINPHEKIKHLLDNRL